MTERAAYQACLSAWIEHRSGEQHLMLKIGITESAASRRSWTIPRRGLSARLQPASTTWARSSGYISKKTPLPTMHSVTWYHWGLSYPGELSSNAIDELALG